MNKTYLSFKIGNETYTIDTNNVINIIEMTNITKIPRTSKNIKGMIDFRGNPILVIDAHKILNINFDKITSKTCIVVLNLGNDKQVGVIVDDVKSVIEINDKDIINSNVNNKYINGIINIDEELIMILNIEELVK